MPSKITDKMRLDWLSKTNNFDEVLSPMNGFANAKSRKTWWAGQLVADQRKTLRQAIDVVLRSERRAGRKTK